MIIFCAVIWPPQSLESLNTDDSLAQALESGLVNLEYLSRLPLAHIDGDRPLSLSSGLNPAWWKDLMRFFQLSSPLRAQADCLTREDWRKISDNFAAYAGALAGKPAPVKIEAAYPPTGTIEELSGERIKEILDSDVAARFQALLDQDQAAPGASTEVAALERLVYYHRYLYRFLMNFASFYDFYSGHEAMFQTGTLYIDSRGCQLCLPVKEVAAHSVLAAFSQLCLVYCQCRRRQKAGQNLPEETINIVAAITAGDSDLLMEGRNGVYVDNQANDWDATIIKLINNPIDLRQAVWEPYKKIGRFISEQINKFTGAQDDKLLSAATQKISGLASSLATPAAPKPAGATPFDIGKSVGIFAAIGLALGALGTAVASIARAVFALSWYEIPLIFVALFLIISGPSVVLAWLKLRKRSIGPLLEASGWAINSRVPINISLGHKLTDTAILPDNALRSYNDPLKPPRKWTWILLVILALALGSAIGWFWIQPDLGLEDLNGVDNPAPVAAPAAEPNQGG